MNTQVSHVDRAKIMAFAIQNDPMKMGEGAFIGLCTQNNVKVIRGGTGFAVKALTCNGIVLSFLERKDFGYFTNNDDLKIAQDFDAFASSEVAKHINEDIVLYLPDALSAYYSMGANKSVGLGGAEHELGHIICDKANKMPPIKWFSNFIPVIRSFIQAVSDPNYKNKSTGYFYGVIPTLAKFSNLFADIRLENMMPVLYPPTKQRFVDTQKCIFALEDKGLAQADSLSIMLVMMRDLGKNHKSDELTDRFEFYKNNFPKEWKLVNTNFLPLIKRNQVKSSDIDGTLHCPMVSALEFLIAMKDLIENPPQEPKEPGDEGEETDGDGDNSDNKGKDKDKEDGDKGDGDANKENKNKNKNDGDKSDGDKSDGDKGDDSNNEMKENNKENKSENKSQGKSLKDTLENIQRAIDRGNYNTDTLDVFREKAEKEIAQLDKDSGSLTYIPNGHKVVYLDRKKGDRGITG